MSSSIWMQCAGTREIRPLRLQAWRVVEGQHVVSTRKLVRTLEEQALLELLIDGVKPPAVGSPRQHYLLTTPFRYPPLRHGSRFGTRAQRGIWYGAESVTTALCEVAFYRLRFLSATHADLGYVSTLHTAFVVAAHSARGVDLAAAPFEAFRDRIRSPTAYIDSQALGQAMRAADVELVRYPSARDDSGVGVAAFSPAVFGSAQPRQEQTWHARASHEGVEFTRAVGRRAVVHRFAREQYLVDGVLPVPAT